MGHTLHPGSGHTCKPMPRVSLVLIPKKVWSSSVTESTDCRRHLRTVHLSAYNTTLHLIVEYRGEESSWIDLLQWWLPVTVPHSNSLSTSAWSLISQMALGSMHLRQWDWKHPNSKIKSVAQYFSSICCVMCYTSCKAHIVSVSVGVKAYTHFVCSFSRWNFFLTPTFWATTKNLTFKNACAGHWNMPKYPLPSIYVWGKNLESF